MLLDDVSQHIGGWGIFRLVAPGQPDFEAVIPVQNTVMDRQVLLFDNTNGFITGLAIANGKSLTETVQATIRDENGNVLGRMTKTFQAFEHVAAALPNYFTATTGKKGTIEFQAAEYGISAIALRFNPTGPFTSLHPLMNPDW